MRNPGQRECSAMHEGAKPFRSVIAEQSSPRSRASGRFDRFIIMVQGGGAAAAAVAGALLVLAWTLPLGGSQAPVEHPQVNVSRAKQVRLQEGRLQGSASACAS